MCLSRFAEHNERESHLIIIISEYLVIINAACRTSYGLQVGLGVAEAGYLRYYMLFLKRQNSGCMLTTYC